jgi:hypothetical protein
LRPGDLPENHFDPRNYTKHQDSYTKRTPFHLVSFRASLVCDFVDRWWSLIDAFIFTRLPASANFIQPIRIVRLTHKAGVISISHRSHPPLVWSDPSNYFFAGEAAGLAVTVGLVPFGAAAAGLVVALDAALAAGEATAPGAAGRKPRLLGLLSMSPARLFTIFDSFTATSSKAASRISLRDLIRA